MSNSVIINTDRNNSSPTNREKDIYDKLVEEGIHIDGHAESWCPVQEISWFDKKKYEAGKQSFQEYGAINFMFIGINCFVLGLIGKPITAYLVRRHPPKTFATKIYARGLSTINRMKSWIWTELTNPTASGNRQIKITRGMHNAYVRNAPPIRSQPLPLQDEDVPQEYHELAEDIRKSLESVEVPTASIISPHISWNPESRPFTQLHMGSVLTLCFNFLWVQPKLAKSIPMEAKENITYIWALVGRLLGLKDEFNIALNPSTKLYHKAYLDLNTLLFKEIDATAAMFLRQGFKTPAFPFYVLIRENIGLYWAITWLGGDASVFRNRMNLYEKLVVFIVVPVSVFLYLHVWPIRWLGNFLFDIVFGLAVTYYQRTGDISGKGAGICPKNDRVV